MGVDTYLLVGGNDNVIKLDYHCGPSSAPTPDTDRCEVYGDDEDCEDEEANNESDEEDDESNGNIDVQVDGHFSSFHKKVFKVQNKVFNGRFWSSKF